MTSTPPRLETREADDALHAADVPTSLSAFRQLRASSSGTTDVVRPARSSAFAGIAAGTIGLGAALAVALSLHAPWASLLSVPAVLGAWLMRPARLRRSDASVSIEVDAETLEKRIGHVSKDLVRMAASEDLQHGVFEVSSELIGCLEPEETHQRFSAALRRYWSAHEVELLVWERGEWLGFGCAAIGSAPDLQRPIQLPSTTDANSDLVLDLSPAVSGQAAVVMRGARPQPSMDGCSLDTQHAVAEVLRGQLALTLRRVVLYRDLQELARMDALTNTHRRWYGELRLHELLGSNRVLTVIAVDIDHFKQVNDRHGHAQGDRVLSAVGACLNAQVRVGDLVVRTGGEEFLIVLPDTAQDGALIVAERIRSAVAAVPHLPCRVTVSLGLTTRRSDDNERDLLARADAACYAAKQQGRDRVVVG